MDGVRKYKISYDSIAKDDESGGVHTRIAEAICNLIRGNDQGCTIGLEGKWGSGKTTVISQIIKNFSNDSSVMFYYFDAWAHEGNELRKAFLVDLLFRLGVDKDSWFTGKLEEKWLGTKSTNESGKRNRYDGGIRDEILGKKQILWEIPEFDWPNWIMFIMVIIIGVLLYIFNLVKEDQRVDYIYSIWSNIYNSWISIPILPLWFILISLISFFYYSTYKNLPKTFQIGVKRLFSLSISNNKTIKSTLINEVPTLSSVEFEYYFRILCEDIFPNSQIKDNRKLIFVLDNLDRVNSEVALSILSTLQIFLTNDCSAETNDIFKNLWAIIPYDIHGLKKIWAPDDPLVASSFLEKRFQIIFHIPPFVFTKSKSFFIKEIQNNFKGDEHILAYKEDVYRIYRVLFPHMKSKIIKSRMGQDNIDSPLSSGSINPNGEKDFYDFRNYSPTPREIKHFINQFGIIYWMNEDLIDREKIPVTHIAYYVCLQEIYNGDLEIINFLNPPISNKQNEKEDIRGEEEKQIIDKLPFYSEVVNLVSNKKNIGENTINKLEDNISILLFSQGKKEASTLMHFSRFSKAIINNALDAYLHNYDEIPMEILTDSSTDGTDKDGLNNSIWDQVNSIDHILIITNYILEHQNRGDFRNVYYLLLSRIKTIQGINLLNDQYHPILTKIWGKKNKTIKDEIRKRIIIDDTNAIGNPEELFEPLANWIVSVGEKLDTLLNAGVKLICPNVEREIQYLTLINKIFTDSALGKIHNNEKFLRNFQEIINQFKEWRDPNKKDDHEKIDENLGALDLLFRIYPEKTKDGISDILRFRIRQDLENDPKPENILEFLSLYWKIRKIEDLEHTSSDDFFLNWLSIAISKVDSKLAAMVFLIQFVNSDDPETIKYQTINKDLTSGKDIYKNILNGDNPCPMFYDELIKLMRDYSPDFKLFQDKFKKCPEFKKAIDEHLKPKADNTEIISPMPPPQGMENATPQKQSAELQGPVIESKVPKRSRRKHQVN